MITKYFILFDIGLKSKGIKDEELCIILSLIGNNIISPISLNKDIYIDIVKHFSLNLLYNIIN